MAAANMLVVDPALPPWAPELIVRDLRVGTATVALRFWRHQDGASRWEVLQQKGTLHVLRQPPPESVTATWGRRLRGALESMLPGG